MLLAVGEFNGIFSDQYGVTPATVLQLTATPSTQTVGQTTTLRASGAGTAGTLVRYQVMSGPDTGLTAIIAAHSTGTAVATFKGIGVGTDTIVAWLDYNNNGVVDPGTIRDCRCHLDCPAVTDLCRSR